VKTYYIISGGFDPIHEGHVAMFKDAAAKSDGIIVLLNSDEWLERKKGKFFMDFNARAAVSGNMKGVIGVLAFDDSDNSAADGIRRARQLYPDARLVFAKGGDRATGNIPVSEHEAGKQCNVELEFGVGGENKANSSSWIINRWNETNNKKE
jgi:D-beta-D-heptose 7-phosphate kinase/D-beta-D-heptose 1-phosphate adenosyltransferase